MGKCIGCNHVESNCALFYCKHDCPCNVCLVKVMCKDACNELITFVNTKLQNVYHKQ